MYTINMKIKHTTVALLSAVLFLTPLITSATGPPTTFENPIGATNFSIFIQRIILFIIAFAGLLALLAITYGGAMIILGGMKSEQDLRRGKEIIFWALGGLLIIGMSALILNIIGGWLGI